MPEPIRLNSQYHHWLVTAHPGTGKTVLCASAPNTLLVRSPVDQIDSIFTMNLQDNVQEEIVRDWNDMSSIVDFLRHEKHNFKWLSLDCYSIIQDELLQSILDDIVKDKPHRDPNVPDQGEYLRNMKRFQKWVRDICGVPINLIITAHPWRVEDDVDDTVLYYPWIQGKNMPQTISGYMKLIAHLTTQKDKKGEEHRVLITSQTDKYYAKDMYGAFGGKMVDPTVPKMLAKIEKATGKDRPVRTTPKKTTRKRATTKKTAAKKGGASKRTNRSK